MSASTVALTANPGANNSPVLALGARRRTVSVSEKRASSIDLISDSNGVDNSQGRDSHGQSIRLEKAPKETKKTVANSTVSPPRRRKVVAKQPEILDKPKWQTAVSVLAKNFVLLIIVLGLVQMIRKLTVKPGSGDGSVSAGDLEGRIAEVEGFLKTTAKMLQVQMEVVDKKIGNEVGNLRRELVKKVEEKGAHFENELKKLEGRTDGLGKALGELKAIEFLTKEDFKRFSDELRKSARSESSDDKDLSLDEIRALAKKIVENEIEKHAADGLGRVNYALASAGAIVVAHSEPFFSGKGSSWFSAVKGRNNVHSDSVKMLQPSFGEPGQCFPLKGKNGFVEIRLRTAIVPEAITLEHVAKSVAYDRTSAPKDCRISGWFEGRSTDPSSQTKEKFLLAEFAYDLERSNAQTFNVESTDMGIINMVRLDFASNHGGGHTCIYRLRVHGKEPDSVALSTVNNS